MTYEVHFKLRDAEYTVRGPDTAGILALIDGLEPKGEVPPQRLREAYAQLMAQEPPLPEIADPHAELRATWAAGQRWQAKNGFTRDQWLDIVDDREPEWNPNTVYRRAPEDVWITWAGGDCPLHDADVSVDYRMRDGMESTGIAGTLRWGHTVGFATTQNDIVAYRVVSPCA